MDDRNARSKRGKAYCQNARIDSWERAKAEGNAEQASFHEDRLADIEAYETRYDIAEDLELRLRLLKMRTV